MKLLELGSLEKHLASAADHQAPVYTVLAKDATARGEGVQLLKKYFSKNGEFVELDGEKTTLSALSEALFTLPMFASSRTLHISEVDQIAKEGHDKIVSALTPPHPKLRLILSASALRANTNFYKALENEGVVLAIPEEKNWEKEKNAALRIQRLVQAQGKKIAHQALQALAKLPGSALESEIEKLSLYCDQREEITLEDVKQIAVQTVDEDIFQLRDALVYQNPTRAYAIIKALLAQETALLPLLRLLRTQMQQMMHLLTLRNHPDQLQQLYPWMRGGILSKNRELAERMGENRCLKAILLIDETELNSKNSEGDPEWLLERLVARCV